MASGLEYRIHPLVLVQISDHFTRVRAQGVPEASQRVVGCLLGTQSSRTVEITNAFELKCSMNGEQLQIDGPYMLMKQEQYKRVFPKYEVVGWYSTGSGLHEGDLNLHKTLTEITESPVYVLFDATLNPAMKNLPITVYETELRLVNEVPVQSFAQAQYTIQTGEAERIAVDHVARIYPSGTNNTAFQLTAHLGSMHSALKMLHTRVQVLSRYLAGVQTGTITADQAVLRKVMTMIRMLPVLTSPAFQDSYLVEHNDTLLVNYVALLTKMTTQVSEMVDHFAMANEKQSRRGRGLI